MEKKRCDELKKLIQDGLTDKAIRMVKTAQNYLEGEEFVFVVLEEKSAPELVEAVLQSYLGTRENCENKHGRWVHSLSHFTEILWQRRMDDWIKKFNEVSFKGANEFRDFNASGRLVGDFMRFAKIDDDPADFAITLNNLNCENMEVSEYAKARIEVGRFESEEAFLRWKLRRHELYTYHDNEVFFELVDVKKIRSTIQQLQSLGADVSEFNGLEKDLLTKRLNDLEADLAKTTSSFRESLEKGIQKMRAALNGL